ncbi:MAG: acyl-CoA desaturase [Bacteroidia bacterium]
MSIPAVKFNMEDRPEFIKELRKKVNQHFKDNNLSRHANFDMKAKTAFMLALYFVPFGLMLTGVVTTLWPVMLMWVLMSLGMSGIGLAIMHDANHGSYSSNQKVNNVLGFLVNFIGAYHTNWKIQHNMLHHSFTNIDGYDSDIEKPIMRFSPNQKRKKYFRFQAFYAPFFYGLMTIYWFLSKDFESVIKYSKTKLLAKQGITLKKAFREVLFNKAWYVALTLGLPIILIALPWWQVLLGFLMMHFISGLLLAFIFQSAHVIQETDFYETDPTGGVENNWAIHQMRTTANFANNSKWFSWLIGGLNFQIEHHLFPHICHVHYKRISSIVKETAEEFDVPYYQHKTFFGALRSHFSLLNQLGTGKYDRLALAAAATKADR